MTREEKNKKQRIYLNKLQLHEKLKKRLTIIFKIIFFLSLFIFSFFLYTRYIATSGLVVKEEKIESTNLPNSFNGFKIVQFSDLHYGSTIFIEQLENIVSQINLRKPDIVVFTGDFIDKNYILKDNEKIEIINLLKKINTTCGKYAVKGNHDYDTTHFDDILSVCGFTVLNNNYDLIYYKGMDPILLVGVGSDIKNDFNKDLAFNYFKLEGNNPNIYTVAILHEPDLINNILTTYNVDLALSGHSHNGQVRIPFYGSIVTINGAKKYHEEFYQINNTKLYISGGLGTSSYPIRLFNRPSFNFFRLTKTN